MTRPPRPPAPDTSLAHLLRRVGAELRRIPLDPDLPRRVERAVRADLARARGRGLPRWAAVAAALLLALAAGTARRSTPRASLLVPARAPAVEPVPVPPPPAPERLLENEEDDAR